MQNFSYQVGTVTPTNDFAPIPTGWYTAQVIEAVLKPTSRADGMLVAGRVALIDGQYQNRQVFFNLNVANPNPKAVEIGLGELDSLCRAVGVQGIMNGDFSVLLNRPIEVKLGLEDYNGETRNKVKGYRTVGGQGAATTGQAFGQQPYAQQFAGGGVAQPSLPMNPGSQPQPQVQAPTQFAQPVQQPMNPGAPAPQPQLPNPAERAAQEARVRAGHYAGGERPPGWGNTPAQTQAQTAPWGAQPPDQTQAPTQPQVRTRNGGAPFDDELPF